MAAFFLYLPRPLASEIDYCIDSEFPEFLKSLFARLCSAIEKIINLPSVLDAWNVRFPRKIGALRSCNGNRTSSHTADKHTNSN